MDKTTTRRRVLKGMAVLALMGAAPLFGLPAWAKGKGEKGGKGESMRREVAEDPKERAMTEEELQQRKEKKERLREQAEEQKELRKGKSEEVEEEAEDEVESEVEDKKPKKVKEKKKKK